MSDSEQHRRVRTEFSEQAANWGNQPIPEHLQTIVSTLDLHSDAVVLDVGAGTGLFSRALAPHVQTVVALDLTLAMLEQGRRDANRYGISNIQFELGSAEQLPFKPCSFDLVVSRWLFHHLVAPRDVLREMRRVCRSTGRVVVVDLVAPDNRQEADDYNQLERWRDPSHTKALSALELTELFVLCGLDVEKTITFEVESDVDGWFDFARTPLAMRLRIKAALEAELVDGPATGLQPRYRNNQLTYTHCCKVVISKPRC